MEDYIDAEELEGYIGKTVDVILWNAQSDRDHDEGARASLTDAELCRADEHGWEFLAQAPDDCLIAFNAREVDEIVKVDDTITIHVRLVR